MVRGGVGLSQFRSFENRRLEDCYETLTTRPCHGHVRAPSPARLCPTPPRPSPEVVQPHSEKASCLLKLCESYGGNRWEGSSASTGFLRSRADTTGALA